MRNRIADVVGRLLWLVAMGGAALAAAEFFMTSTTTAEISAPQLAALAAQCLVYAIVPYVFARAWDELTRPQPKAS